MHCNKNIAMHKKTLLPLCCGFRTPWVSTIRRSTLGTLPGHLGHLFARFLALFRKSRDLGVYVIRMQPPPRPWDLLPAKDAAQIRTTTGSFAPPTPSPIRQFPWRRMERLRGFGAHTGADTNAAILVSSTARAGRDLAWPGTLFASGFRPTGSGFYC
jgi:hypothetical protein